MRPVSRTVRRSTGDSAGAPGLFRVDANTTPFGSEDATPGSRACVRVRALLGRVFFFFFALNGAFCGWPGWAGRPPGRVLVRLTFPLAVLGSLFACSAPSGLGLPCLWLLLVFFVLFSVASPLLPLVAPPLCPALHVFRPHMPWALASCAPPFFFCFPSPLLCAPLSPSLRVFRPGVRWALASCCPPPSLYLPPPSLLSLAFPAFRLPWASAPPLPPFFSLFFSPLFSLLSLPVVRAGRVCVSWAVGCASMVLSLSLLCVRWLVLCGVGCWAGLSCAVSWWVLVSCFGGAVRPMDRKEPTAHGSDALGRPSRPTGPVAGAVLQGLWSEPGQTASGTMANVTWGHGSNR